MLIARINLGLGITSGELGQKSNSLAAEGIPNSKGTAHRHFVRQAFLKDRMAYVRRIVGLVTCAGERGAAVVQLPATSVLVDSCIGIEAYASAFPANCFVVAGLLDMSELGHKGDTREGAVVLQGGGVLSSFPTDHHAMSARAGELGGRRTIVAISSTIKEIRTNPSLCLMSEVGSGRRLLVLDLGHEQYLGRYKKTLTSVHQHLTRKWQVEAVVILAQWRFAGNSAKDPWLIASTELHATRVHDLDEPGHRSGDELDLVTLADW